MLERLLDTRNRVLANTGYQRYLARSFLTRWVARKKAKTLFDITVGFVYSQALYALIELDILEQLRAGPLALEKLADYGQVPKNNLLPLLESGAALGLLHRRGDGCFALGELGAALLGNPGIASMIRHHKGLYKDLQDPVGLLRAGHGEAMHGFWSYVSENKASENKVSWSKSLAVDSVSEYSDLMADSQQLIAADVLDAVSFADDSSLLDVGGGAGAFVSAALRRWPDLSATLLDLSPVATLASQRFERHGLAARTSVCGADMFKDEYPSGQDIVTLVRVLHDHDDAAVLQVLGQCHKALSDSGKLVIAEPMAGDSPEGRSVGAYFHLYLLAMGSGRPRTVRELSELLRQSGFVQIKKVATARPLITKVMVARKV